MAGQHQEAAPAQELVLAAGHDLGAGFAAVVGLVVVVLVLFEARRDRAFAQHDVEGLFDVVGMEFLVEIDDVVLFVIFDGFRGRHENAGNGDDVDDLGIDHVDEVVVDDVDDIVVVLYEILFEHVLVDVVLFERRLVVEVVVTHSGCLLAGRDR